MIIINPILLFSIFILESTFKYIFNFKSVIASRSAFKVVFVTIIARKRWRKWNTYFIIYCYLVLFSHKSTLEAILMLVSLNYIFFSSYHLLAVSKAFLLLLLLTPPGDEKSKESNLQKIFTAEAPFRGEEEQTTNIPPEQFILIAMNVVRGWIVISFRLRSSDSINFRVKVMIRGRSELSKLIIEIYGT